jgi:hypothetical protein
MSEFARPVAVDRLPAGETVYDIAATPEERLALAKRLGLLALDRLEARVALEPVAGGLTRLAAELTAEVQQECVVTLEPVASRIVDRFTLVYGRRPDEGEVVLSGEAELVEPLAGDAIDLGEAVAQQLSLALDPYPRAPGAAVPPLADPASTSPFAGLARRKEPGQR